MDVSEPGGDESARDGGRADERGGRAARLAAFLKRHWLATAFLVLLLVVRAALPLVLRPVLRDQAQAAIRGQVDIGDVDLWLLWGGVGLDDVAVRSEPGAEPVLGWDQLYVRISWLELFRRTVLLREIGLVRPRVDLERLADGEINLARLLPEPTAEPEPAASGSDWRIALDDFTLVGGRIDFEDASVKAAKPLRVDVQSLQVAGGGVAGAGYEGKSTIAARLEVEGAPVKIDAEIARGEAGIESKVQLDVQGFPVDHAVAYSPYGWEELRGRLDVSGEWELGAAGSRGKGRVALRDVGVRIRGAEASGAEWSALEVDADAIDLTGREVRLARVRWVAPKVAIEPGEPIPLPILRRVVREAIVEPAKEAAREDAADATPEPPAEAAAPPPEKPDAAPEKEDAGPAWRWSVAVLDVERLHILSSNAERRTELDIDLHAESLADPSEKAGTIRFEVRPAEGALTGTGELRISPLEIRSELDWKDLDVAALVTTVPRPEVAGFASARSTGKLQVRSTDDGGLALAGEISAANLSFEGASPSVPRLGWESLDVKIDALALPGVLAGAPAPPTIELASLRLAGARVAIERAPAGDGTATAAEATASAPAEEPVAAPSPAARGAGGSAPSAAGEAAPAAGPTLTVGELEIADSGVEILDRGVGDPVRAEIAKIELRARGLAWPARRVEQLDLTMDGPAGATVKLTGASKPSSSDFDLEVKGLELVSFDAYGREYGGVTIEGGTASLTSSIGLTDDRYETDSNLVLHDLDLSGEEGERSFQERFGVPLGLALALLRDVGGDITLDLPVSGGREGIGVGLGKVLTTTLQRVLVNALASPLKLIGSVVVAGGSISGFDVEPIPFVAGTADLAPEAEERIAAIGTLLAERPELAMRLEGQVGRTDLSRLREASAASALADPKSAAAKELASLDDEAADAVRDYLEREPGSEEESAERPAALKKVLAKIEVPRDRLVNLGLERAERARAALAARPGVAPDQLEVRTGTGEVRAKEPRVIVEMKAR